MLAAQNTAEIGDGGALKLTASSSLLLNTTVRNNDAGGDGGGLALETRSTSPSATTFLESCGYSLDGTNTVWAAPCS